MRKQQACRPLVDRFWEKVDKGEGCWEWTANCLKKKDGTKRYGLLGAGRRGEGMLYAHRVSWELHNGAIPQGLMVLHRCDNPLCVRPDHLFLGDQTDNMQDMIRKGRGGRTGPKAGTGAKSTLTKRQIVSMRREGEAGVGMGTLSDKYGVCVSTVRNILLRLTNQNR